MTKDRVDVGKIESWIGATLLFGRRLMAFPDTPHFIATLDEPLARRKTPATQIQRLLWISLAAKASNK